jgi:hypothetical protein
LFIAPEFDAATHYSKYWCDLLVSSTSKYLNYAYLEGLSATRGNVETFLKQRPTIEAVVFFDHGDENGLVAQDGKGYVLDENNLDLVKGKFIYTLACYAGKKYGVEAWKRGCKFIGYDDTFGFTEDEQELFGDAAGYGFELWARGLRDFKKIKEAMIDRFNRLIDTAKSFWTKVWLQHDRDHLVVYDAEAPSSRCVFRRFLLWVFGVHGWRFKRWHSVAAVLFGIGWGLAAHDLWVEICKSGSPWRIHGGYIGLALMLLSVFLSIGIFRRVFRSA